MNGDRVICHVVFPEGEDGFDERLTLHRVPVEGDEISLGIDGEGDWPAHLAGLILKVKSVMFSVVGPEHGNPPPPYVVVGRT